MKTLRALALDNEYNADFRTTPSRNAGLYRALEATGEMRIVAATTPRVSRPERLVNTALHVMPRRDWWRNRADVNPWAFRHRTAAARRILAEHEGDFDVVLQLYALFAPGVREPMPYALYVDNTLAITLRERREAAPLTRRARRRLLAVERDTYEHAAAIFAMSRFAAASLADDYGVDPARVSVVGAGTNIALDSLDERRPEGEVALFAGLDFRRKGGKELLVAWREVRRRRPQAELWIAGPPARADGDGVRWLGCPGPAELAEFYARASVFVLPSWFDPFPHALREAMGHGLPCVSTRQGGVPETVDDGVTGLLVTPGDVAGLADALAGLLGDPDRAAAMGAAGHRRVVEEMSWTAVAGRMLDRLHGLNGRRPER